MRHAVVRGAAIACLAVITGCTPGMPPGSPVAGVAAAQGVDPLRTRTQVEPLKSRLWHLAREGLQVLDLSGRAPLQVPLPGWHWAGPPRGCLPGLAFGPAGEAVLGSDVLPVLWRVDAQTLAVSVHPLALDADRDRDVGFSGVVYSREHGAYLAVAGMQGTLWRIDRSLQRASRIDTDVRAFGACAINALPGRRENAGARLCLRSPARDWTVQFAPDARNARVREAPCATPPSPLGSLIF